jgi:hypothetical protein
MQNKSLSDDPDAMLTLQGVGWWTRKGIAYATITLHVKQTPLPADPATGPPTNITIAQTITGGMEGTTEERTLDWTERGHEDHIFGNVRGKSRWIELGDVKDEFLKEGWLDESQDGRGGLGWIESYTKNEERGWDAQQVWGFAVVDGKRFYTRRVIAIKGEEKIMIRLVYDFVKRPDDAR